MALTSSITPYNPAWPGDFSSEADRLEPVFSTALAAIHHVGSTAVPGLAAKPEIDVLVSVTALREVGCWTEQLAALGYRRGGDLSPGHLFYKRDVEDVRTHKLHVCVQDHPAAQQMLVFRDHLRASAPARQEYQQLKLRLERESSGGIGEYLAGKRPYIRQVLRGLDDLRV